MTTKETDEIIEGVEDNECSESFEETKPLEIPSLPDPITPLQDSYTWHTPLPTAPGPYILGVDEAGRGPVLGPLVYGIAYCAESWEEELNGLGFAGKLRCFRTEISQLFFINRFEGFNTRKEVKSP